MRLPLSSGSGKPPPFRPIRGDLVVAGAILALSVCLALLLYRTPGDGPVTAVVSVNGEEQMRINLSAVKDATEYAVDCAYPLHITAEPGRIRVSESDCPGKDCVRSGWASEPGRTIVCLPNRLTITLESGKGPRFDAVTG